MIWFLFVFFLGCEVGYYGENCLMICDYCKNNGICGIRNGECDSLGCVIGYLKKS